MRLLDRLIKRDGYWEGLASGAAILTTSYGSPDREQLLPQLTQWALSAFGNTSPVFSAAVVRMLIFAQAELKLQAKDDLHVYTDQSLSLLQEPWPDAGTPALLARMELDDFIAGNAYIWAPPGEGVLARLRPDWTTIISEKVSVSGGGWYRRKIGYWVQKPGPSAQGDGFFIPAEEVAHWAPLPDPQADFRGMSWLTPVYREIQGDSGMTEYKVKYLDNAASPNLLIRYAQKLSPGTVDSIRERMKARYGGVSNAFKTLVLDQGADATVIGNSLSQMDFTNVQQASSDRILAASQVPGILVGLEPLRGAGKGYEESVTFFANKWARPAWQSACQVLAKFVPDLPGGARLWYDTANIPLLQDGEMTRAQASLVRMQALLAGRQAGYTRDSLVTAVNSGDLTKLVIDPDAPAPGASPVQHMLGQAQPGATADPLPSSLPRLGTGSVSPGDGGNGTRPTPRPMSARRAEDFANELSTRLAIEAGRNGADHG